MLIVCNVVLCRSLMQKGILEQLRQSVFTLDYTQTTIRYIMPVELLFFDSLFLG